MLGRLGESSRFTQPYLCHLLPTWLGPSRLLLGGTSLDDTLGSDLQPLMQQEAESSGSKPDRLGSNPSSATPWLGSLV